MLTVGRCRTLGSDVIALLGNAGSTASEQQVRSIPLRCCFHVHAVVPHSITCSRAHRIAHNIAAAPHILWKSSHSLNIHSKRVDTRSNYDIHISRRAHRATHQTIPRERKKRARRTFSMDHFIRQKIEIDKINMSVCDINRRLIEFHCPRTSREQRARPKSFGGTTGSVSDTQIRNTYKSK